MNMPGKQTFPKINSSEFSVDAKNQFENVPVCNIIEPDSFIDYMHNSREFRLYWSGWGESIRDTNIHRNLFVIQEDIMPLVEFL